MGSGNEIKMKSWFCHQAMESLKQQNDDQVEWLGLKPSFFSLSLQHQWHMGLIIELSVMLIQV